MVLRGVLFFHSPQGNAMFHRRRIGFFFARQNVSPITMIDYDNYFMVIYDFTGAVYGALNGVRISTKETRELSGKVRVSQ